VVAIESNSLPIIQHDCSLFSTFHSRNVMYCNNDLHFTHIFGPGKHRCIRRHRPEPLFGI